MSGAAGWIAAAVLGAALGQTGADDPRPSEAMAATPAAQSSAVTQPAAPAFVFGQVLPEIHAEAWYPPDAGVSLADLRGKFVLIEFWKTKCQFCKRSHQAMAALLQKYGDRVAVIGLAREAPETAIPFLEELKCGYPMGVGSTTLAEWRISKVPYIFLVDPDGRLLNVSKPQGVEPVLRDALAGRYPLWMNPQRVALYETLLGELEERAARGDTVRVWADAFRIRNEFPLMHPVYERARRLMVEQIKVGKDKIGRARALIGEGRDDQARRMLQEIQRDYEGALLERDAAVLLRRLDTEDTPGRHGA
jgi:thiol-disulfide isomerase/thioredoxin